MKKTIQLSLFLLFLVAITPAKAQQGDRMEEMKKKSDELKAKLNLSEPQAVKYDEIIARNREEAKKKMQALPENAPPNERREIMKKSLENADGEILEILDTEQQTIYKAEKEKMKEAMVQKKKKKK
jgi:hypothetical protein